MSNLPIAIGGLMRCCTESIREYTGSEEVGSICACMYAPNDPLHRAVVVVGADGNKSWEWIRPDSLGPKGP